MDTEDWISLVEKALGASVQAAEERVTSHPAVSEWLNDASYEAAVGTGGAGDRTGMQAFHRLSEEFEQRFATLLEAVRRVTCGCGRAALDWQPGDPRHTKVRISFGQEFPVHIFGRLDDLTESAVRRLLSRLVDRLPKGAPYPGKPHRVGAIISHEDICAAVRLSDAAAGSDERRRFITIYADGDIYAEHIPLGDAGTRIVSFLNERTSPGDNDV